MKLLLALNFIILTVVTMYWLTPREHIGKVDFDYLIPQIVLDISKNELSEKKIEVRTKERIKKLDEVLQKLARKKRLTMHSRAVITGGIDLTKEVKGLMIGGNE